MTTVIFCQDKSIASAASCHKTPPIVHDLVNGSLARLCPSDTSRIRPRLQRHHLWQNVTFKPFLVEFGQIHKTHTEFCGPIWDKKSTLNPYLEKKSFFFFWII